MIAEPAIGGRPGRIALNDTGSAALATAGSGDALTGVIAGFLARGVPAFEAAVCGAWVHGRAAERVAESLGDTGVVAGDVVASPSHLLSTTWLSTTWLSTTWLASRRTAPDDR